MRCSRRSWDRRARARKEATSMAVRLNRKRGHWNLNSLLSRRLPEE